jgi:hypothetical protein
VSRDFDIIRLKIDKAALKTLDNRRRNQLVGCMHAHNELTVLNRLLMLGLLEIEWAIFGGSDRRKHAGE